MSELDELKQLVAQQTRDMQAQNAANQARDAINQKLVACLIGELARGHAPAEDGGVAAAGAAAAVVAARAERINKMNIALRKSQKVKEYREVNDISIKEWLTRFDQEINALKRIYGVIGDLTRDEIVEFFKDRLDYKVIKRLDTTFAVKEPVWT